MDAHHTIPGRVSLAIAACAWILSATASHATSIAVVRTPTNITIAADSLVTVADSSGLHRVRASKLHSAGGLYFTAAGVTLDPDADLDTTRTGAAVLAGPGDIEQKAHLIAVRLRAPLLRSFQMRQHSMQAADYAEFMAGGDTALDFVIAGWENSVPTVAVITFRRSKDRMGRTIAMTPVVHMCPGNGCKGGTWYYILGYNREARSRYRTASFWRTDASTVARRIVEIEAKGQPQHVGLPIDVLQIDRRGAFWVPPFGLGRRPNPVASPPRPAYASSASARQSIAVAPVHR